MNKKFFLSAITSGILALAMGGNAIAASVTGVTNATVVDRGRTQDAVIEAGTDPSNIQLHFAGAELISFVDLGTIKIVNADGTTWRYRPSVYQTVNGKKRVLMPGFRILGKDRVSLTVSGYDPSEPIVLGPIKAKS